MKRKSKKILAAVMGLTLMSALSVGCQRQSERVSYNISKQADNFNTIRQITVINCIQGDVLFQMTGRMSLNVVPQKISLKSLLKMKTAHIKSIL